jgi:hypothetical protein
MFNPILSEMIAREQHRDRLREAGQHRLVAASTPPQTEQRHSLGAWAVCLLISVRYMFRAHARAE